MSCPGCNIKMMTSLLAADVQEHSRGTIDATKQRKCIECKMPSEPRPKFWDACVTCTSPRVWRSGGGAAIVAIVQEPVCRDLFTTFVACALTSWRNYACVVGEGALWRVALTAIGARVQAALRTAAACTRGASRAARTCGSKTITRYAAGCQNQLG